MQGNKPIDETVVFQLIYNPIVLSFTLDTADCGSISGLAWITLFLYHPSSAIEALAPIADVHALDANHAAGGR